MSKTSVFLIIIFSLTLIALLTVNTLYSSKPVLKSIPAMFPTQPVTESENTLSITPSILTVNAGKTTTVQVILDSKGELPTVVQMELAYDPYEFASVAIIPGTFFSSPQVLLNNINANNGRISYAIAPSLDQTTPTVSTLLATITIKPRINAYKRNTTLSFLPKTIIKTKTSQNTLKNAYGAKITIANGFPGFLPGATSSGSLINH
jgi:hypothetical protein